MIQYKKIMLFTCVLIITLLVLVGGGYLFSNGGKESLELELFSNGRLYYDGNNFVIKDKWVGNELRILNDIRTINDWTYSYLLDHNSKKIFVISKTGLQVITVRGLNIDIKEYTNDNWRTDEINQFSMEKNYGNHYRQVYKFSEFTSFEQEKFKELIKLEHSKTLGTIPIFWKNKWPSELKIYP